ncbi:MAG: hypothetical protein K1X79_00455 [Oligoflexia bacterium]|nr:hypothetical protein [Oligoflexia bacterium]
MPPPSDNKHIVIDILNGTAQVEGASSPVIERSVLAAIAESKSPEFKDPYQVFFLAIPFILSVCGFIIILSPHLMFPPYNMVVGLGVLIVMGIAVYHAHKRFKALDDHAKLLAQPLDELLYLQNQIKNFLGNFDRRTTRYFHVVTNSKVSSYFVLTQMATALDQRISEITTLLEDPLRENLQAAHHLLQGTLAFRDSFTAQSGHMHVIPLARLKTVAEQLINYLDTELKALESELRQVPVNPDE